MTIEAELKACPFCGVRDAILYVNEGSFVVECQNCTNRTSMQDSAGEAVAAWNRRALPPVNEGQGTGDAGVGAEYSQEQKIALMTLAHHIISGGTDFTSDHARTVLAIMTDMEARLKAALASTSPRTAQEGFVLVPREPTPKMVFEGSMVGDYPWDGQKPARIYRAMLAASPSPQPETEKPE